MTLIAVERPFELRPLDWDTSFFGARMGTLVRIGGDEAPAAADALRRLLRQAEGEGYRHLIYRTIAADTEGTWAAEAAGMRLVDVGIDSTYRFGHTPRPALPAHLSFRHAGPDDAAALAELAAAAFTLSRFSADPFFTDAQVREFHRAWTRNLCNGLAQAVLVAEIDGQTAGFVSCNVSGDEGRIPLIAVDAAFRGQGVGHGLIARSLEFFASAACRVVHVKTQAHNYPALGLYHRAGFLVTRSELTFSITLGQGSPNRTEVPA